MECSIPTEALSKSRKDLRNSLLLWHKTWNVLVAKTVGASTWTWVAVVVVIGVLLLIACAIGIYCCCLRRKDQAKPRLTADYESESNQ